MSNNKGLFGKIFDQNNNNNNTSIREGLFSFNSGNNENNNASIGGNFPSFNMGSNNQNNSSSNRGNLFTFNLGNNENKKDNTSDLFKNNEDNKKNTLFHFGSGIGLFNNSEDEKDKSEKISNLFGNLDLNNNKDSDNSNPFGKKLFGNDFDNNFNININNIKSFNVNINIENSGNNIFNAQDNDIGNEEVEEDEKKEEDEKEEEDAKEEEERKTIKVSEELDKPDELNSIDNKEYITIINSKMKNYKKEMDSTVDKIEEKKSTLKTHEELFNNFIDKINISNKVINYIKDNLDNNTRQLEKISDEQDKIINDLDFIEKNLNEKIGAQRSKEEFIKNTDTKKKELDDTFINIDKKIELCHKNLKENNNVVENNEIKTLNQLLNRIIHRIKKEVQGKQIEYLDNIFKAEKNALDK
jgi:hypothetical protein